MLNQKQFERWQILIRDCKASQRNINVGGKGVREMLIALDEFVTAQQSMYPTGGDSPATTTDTVQAYKVSNSKNITEYYFEWSMAWDRWVELGSDTDVFMQPIDIITTPNSKHA